MRPITRYLALLNALIGAASANAGTANIGTARMVVPAALAEFESRSAELSVGTSLIENQVIRTGPGGRAGLQFIDETTLDVGPNSSAKLDKFVFNPDHSAAEANLSLTKGLFRLVSGAFAHSTGFRITTPHATLGIRGTELVILVTDDHTMVRMISGVVEGCTTARPSCGHVLDAEHGRNVGQFRRDGRVETFAIGPALQRLRGGAGGSSPPSLSVESNTDLSGFDLGRGGGLAGSMAPTSPFRPGRNGNNGVGNGGGDGSPSGRFEDTSR